jgi:hypothetical protein
MILEENEEAQEEVAIVSLSSKLMISVLQAFKTVN